MLLVVCCVSLLTSEVDNEFSKDGRCRFTRLTVFSSVMSPSLTKDAWGRFRFFALFFLSSIRCLRRTPSVACCARNAVNSHFWPWTSSSSNSRCLARSASRAAVCCRIKLYLASFWRAWNSLKSSTPSHSFPIKVCGVYAFRIRVFKFLFKFRVAFLYFQNFQMNGKFINRKRKLEVDWSNKKICSKFEVKQWSFKQSLVILTKL